MDVNIYVYIIFASQEFSVHSVPFMGCEMDPKAMASEDARTHDTKHTHVEPMRVCSFRLNKTQMVYM